VDLEGVGCEGVDCIHLEPGIGTEGGLLCTRL
jgi:hypothetical protein